VTFCILQLQQNAGIQTLMFVPALLKKFVAAPTSTFAFAWYNNAASPEAKQDRSIEQ
jgi:hypothetical protein